MTRREVIGVYPTYLDAKRAAHDQFQIAYFEQDIEVEYDAADFITEQGAVYSIDPVKGEAA
jgi:hypothetical protein